MSYPPKAFDRVIYGFSVNPEKAKDFINIKNLKSKDNVGFILGDDDELYDGEVLNNFEEHNMIQIKIKINRFKNIKKMFSYGDRALILLKKYE